MKEHNFKNYERFFELEDSIEMRNLTTHAMNTRLIPSLNDILEKHIDMFKRKIGLRLSKNEYINLLLILAINGDQNDKGEIYQRYNGASMTNYIDEMQDELIQMIKDRMFQEQYEAMTNGKPQSLKVKKQAQARIKKKYEPSGE